MVNTRETKEREIELLRSLSNGIVDGFLLATTLDNYSEISSIVPKGFPVVLVDRSLPGAPFDSVMVMNYRAVYASVEYLIRKGHNKIGYMTGLTHISTTAERLEAYKDAMKANGLSTEGLIREGTSMCELVDENLDMLLLAGCTALIVSNNIMTMETMTQLNNRGVKLHTDIEIVGYKDSEQVQYGLHHLSLISQPVNELGRTAGNQLLERMMHPELPIEKLILQAEFLPRE